MTTFVLLPGAGSAPWYWHRVTPLLRDCGHDVVTPDLPYADDTAGLRAYADTVVEAMSGHDTPVLVAHSMSAFTAPLVCERVPVAQLVLLAPMIPAPGETAGQWWDNTGQPRAQRDLAVRQGRDPDAGFDVAELFLHDLDPGLARQALELGERGQSATPFAEPWPLDSWPDVPTRVVSCTDDRIFPADFLRRLTRDRLGLDPEEIPGGHTAMLSHPHELVETLLTPTASRGSPPAS
ncbi:alpha/beta fold hydrolase [Saccharomonospora halophila]|uniref:alpha/beta fold hydrolase n=1 Tax=Saccharomonospora halophila TaxID=129922 RepID=UPI00036FA99F|nr:alpha/beta fold hydrolase [Saccharomonospora halophila]